MVFSTGSIIVFPALLCGAPNSFSPSYRGSALAASAQLAQQLLPRRWVQSGWRRSRCDMSSSAYARGCSLAYANLRYARRAAWA